MRMRRLFLSPLIILLATTHVVAQEMPRIEASPSQASVSAAGAPTIEALPSPVTVRLRGLSAVDANIAWASGREGTVLRTTDAGKTWSVFKVPGAEKLDFRDVEGFSADEAVILSIGPGEDSRVYRTSDGGQSWVLVLRNPDVEGFFDCMDFEGAEGRLLGDPVRGRFQLFASSDGGRSWRWTKGPRAKKDEAAFAASGTCVIRVGKGTAIVTGGARTRAHYLPDQFEKRGDWHALDVQSAHSPSTGLFSVAHREESLLAVGGDYKQEQAPGLAFGFRASDGWVHSDGRSRRWDAVLFDRWSYVDGMPSGYRSGIACRQQPPEDCVATGPGGNDFLVHTQSGYEAKGIEEPKGERKSFSIDDIGVASRWQSIPGIGYDSVDVADGVFWFSGDGGRLGRLVLPLQ